MATKSKLEGLVPELLKIICTQIHHMQGNTNSQRMLSIGGKGLLSLSRTSNTLFNVVQPIICSEISLDYEKTDVRSRKIVSTILDDRLSMRHHVRELTIWDNGAMWSTMNPDDNVVVYLSQYVQNWKRLFNCLPNLQKIRWKSSRPILQELLSLLETNFPTLELSLDLNRRDAFYPSRASIPSLDMMLIPSKLLYGMHWFIKWDICSGSTDFSGTELELISRTVQNSPSIKNLSLSISSLDIFCSEEVPCRATRNIDNAASTQAKLEFDHQITCLTRLECIKKPHDKQRQVHVQAVSDWVFKSIPKWSSLTNLELAQLPASLPFRALDGKCPNLKYLSLTITKENHAPAISFLRSLRSLKHLHIYTWTDVADEEIFPVIRQNVHTLREFTMNAGKIGYPRPDDPNIFLSGRSLMSLATAPYLKELKFAVTAEDTHSFVIFDTLHPPHLDERTGQMMNAIKKMTHVRNITITVAAVKLPNPFVYNSGPLGNQDPASVKRHSDFKYDLAKIIIRLLWTTLHSSIHCKVQTIEMCYELDLTHPMHRYQVLKVEWARPDDEDCEHFTLPDGRKFAIYGGKK